MVKLVIQNKLRKLYKQILRRIEYNYFPIEIQYMILSGALFNIGGALICDWECIWAEIIIKNTPRPRKEKSHTKDPYLLNNPVVQYVNQVWATDMTCICIATWLCLHLCCNWSLQSQGAFLEASNTMNAYFYIKCLEEAIEHYGVPSICNSD